MVQLYHRFPSKLMSCSSNFGFQPKLMSQILYYPEQIPKDKSVLSSCKSLKLMLKNGYIKHVSPGVFTLMPLAVRSLEKLCQLVDFKLAQINGQKVLFPTLIHESFLKTSGRWETLNNLFKLKDRHSFNFCLGPTHEEIATSLLAKARVSYKSLPLRLYQISSKFRDEMNPKLGLLRGREFLMKDMYSFDSTEEDSMLTYKTVCNTYQEIFQSLGLETIKVKSSSGDIGGKYSHEFHFRSEVGEDELLYCPKCKSGINLELQNEDKKVICESCHMPLQKCNGIEVGHAFLLGTAYSKPFQANFDSTTHVFENLQMGCYGLGITRILGASVECLSVDDHIRWPFLIAPYHLSIVPPKSGSVEESAGLLAESLCQMFSPEVLLDDRSHLTIGKRVLEASEMGIPYVLVLGKRALKEVPEIEVIDTYNDVTQFLTHKDTVYFFRNLFLQKSIF